MKKHSIAYVELDKLELDFDNPRFAELYSGSRIQDDLIDYLFYTESAEELAKDIADSQEFYVDRPLWVLRQPDGTYLVKDGNRRCAAAKALQRPNKYSLPQKIVLSELPVLIYDSKEEVEKRIRREHTSSLFRQWDRIAKALEIYKLHSSGNSLESMKDIDSSPADLVKLSSFYYEAVTISGDDLRQLLRRGRGHTGGKTVIFERLFKYRALCGYTFKPKAYLITLTDKKQFKKYVSAMVAYLKTEEGAKTTTQDVDRAGQGFLDKLRPFGFAPTTPEQSPAPPAGVASVPQGTTPPPQPPQPAGIKRKSVKTRPVYQRKQVPRPLVKLIDECYDLDAVNFANAKTALVRVAFECTLKYVVENTVHRPGRAIARAQHFRNAYYDSRGNKRPTTDFELLKFHFADIISDTNHRKAFQNFKLDNPHQIIHNYNVGAVPADATSLCDNLIPLLEFMLQDQTDLLASLDLTKL